MKHRLTRMTRDDFIKPWSLHRLWHNPNVTHRYIGCEVCHPKPPSFDRARAKREANCIIKEES
jgi:hypothetical protein